MTTVCLNGAFLDPDSATVSAFDAGLLHAVGVFETMLGVTGAEGREIVSLGDHVQRLKRSASELGLADTLYEDALAEACVETFEKSGLARARIRLTITGGDLNLLQREAKTNHRPTVLITAQQATAYPAEMLERGVMATVAEARSNPLDPTAGHKTLNYWWRLRELQLAAGKGAGEALVFQVSNHLAGGCVSNAILIRNGLCVTPIVRGEETQGAMPSPVLPGVTRASVLDWIAEEGLDIERRMVTIDDVLKADEFMLTNSSWGVLPVVRVEANEIGEGTRGALTAKLVDRWRERTHAEA